MFGSWTLLLCINIPSRFKLKMFGVWTLLISVSDHLDLGSKCLEFENGERKSFIVNGVFV